jgi:ketosteroid isomerase-like protein
MVVKGQPFREVLAPRGKQRPFGDTARTTSQDNIERVEKGFEAFNSRDFDTALAALRDDVTWERFLSRAETDEPVVHGKDELRAVC